LNSIFDEYFFDEVTIRNLLKLRIVMTTHVALLKTSVIAFPDFPIHGQGLGLRAAAAQQRHSPEAE
jgi:hypothetical protein